MSDQDPVAQAREHLLRRVEEVATGPASLDALYGLEDSFQYSDLWYEATEHFRAAIERSGSKDAWSSELRRPPVDIRLWVPFVRRRETTAQAIEKAAAAWEAKGLDRFFAPHHYVPGITEGAAAVQLTLLNEMDPIAAVEYVAALPSEYLVWPAAHRLQISERPDLVERILRESRDDKAVMLSLACELDAARTLVWRRVSDNDEDNSAARNEAWNVKIPGQLRVLARLLLARGDAGAVIAVWMRHLLRVAKRETKNQDLNARSRIAIIGLEELVAEIKESGTITKLPTTSTNEVADVVARMLLEQPRPHVGLWEEWCEFVRAEHRSLDTDNAAYWRAAADALRRENDPYATWMSSMRKIEPLLRARARGGDRETDPVVHMVMPAVNAAAAMREHGEKLWWAIYERARRHYFVDAPADFEYGHRLCAAVFGAFPSVFGDRYDALTPALELLPTERHIELARATVTANMTDGIAPHAAARDRS